jgi:hypothetical protein
MDILFGKTRRFPPPTNGRTMIVHPGSTGSGLVYLFYVAIPIGIAEK